MGAEYVDGEYPMSRLNAKSLVEEVRAMILRKICPELPSELFDLLKVAITGNDYDWILYKLSEYPDYQ